MGLRDALTTRAEGVFGPSVDERTAASRWLLLAVTAGLLVQIAYVQTHSHPAYEGGLFLHIAEVIRAQGYLLPEFIPQYTANGVPFAYPPLMFYSMAVVVSLIPVDPVTVSLVVPGLVVVATTLPYYALARRLLPSPRQAGLATMLFTVTPAVLQWHISAGGVVRAPAAALTVIGLYAGLRTFETHEGRWMLTTGLLFALVVLSHPVYPVFFGTSCLLFYAARDRSIRGFLLGSGVVVTALVLTAPWWLQVGSTHGFDVFLGATGTRTTLGGTSSRVRAQFVEPITRFEPVTLFYLLAFAGGVYGIARRRYLLPAWLVTSSYLLGEQRFTFVAGSMLSAAVVFELLVPAVGGSRGETNEGETGWAGTLDSLTGRVGSSRRIRRVLVVFIVVIASVAVGAAYAGSALDSAHRSSTTLPETVDTADRDAMAWMRANTDSAAEFVVLGDAAEWVPFYTNRTILISPWGTEWEGSQRFHYHLDRYTTLSECPDAACLDRELSSLDTVPDYLYVPKGDYTIRGAESRQSDRMRRSVEDSPHYSIVFENEGVLVARVRGTSTASTVGSRSHASSLPETPPERTSKPGSCRE